MGIQTPLSTINFHSYQTASGAAVRDVSPLIQIMSPEEIPLLKLIGIDGEVGTNPKKEWLEDVLLAETTALADTGGTTVVSSATNTALVVTAGEGFNLQVGMLVKVTLATDASIFEYMYIRANVSADKWTVIRGVLYSNAGTVLTDGTGYGSFLTGNVVDVVGLANTDNTDAPAMGTTDLTIQSNFYQSFDQYYQLSDMATNTAIYGVPEGDESREFDKAMKQIMVKLDKTAFQGVRTDQATVNGQTVPRLMGGLDFYLNNAMSGTSYLAYHATLANAQLTEKDLNDMLQDRYYTVGAENMGKTVILGAWNKRRVNDMFAPYARTTRNERVGGVVVDTVETDFGLIDVLSSLRCPKSSVYLVNLDFLSIHPYKGLAFFDQELARNGAYTKRQIFGVYSMVVRNAKAQGCIRLTATS